MNVAILGYGVDGTSAANYWHRLGHEITICDQNTDIQAPDWAKTNLGKDYLKSLDTFDLLVRSPGLYPAEITKANPNSPDILKKVTTCVDEFFAKCPAPIIAVSGTKGKGTTSTLIYEFLKAAGKKTWLGGNIGTVPLDFLHKVTAEAWVVLELSNFQLIDFKGHPKVAVCLMMAPEHQDWHPGVEDYYRAKQQLFVKQAGDDLTVYKADNPMSVKITSVSNGQKIPYEVPEENQEPQTKSGAYVEGDTIYMQNTPVCKTSDVKLLGRHNLENVCAAIAATWQIIGGNVEIIKKVLSDFTGLEHRLEFVREVEGVKYYDDSFATTPETTLAAIKAFKEPKVLILGGHHKGIPFFDLAEHIAKDNISQVIAIGDTAKDIIDLLNQRGYNNIVLGGNTMTEIIKATKEVTKPGDVVLLSPACSSFGLFKNYKDRGDQFKAAINSL